MSYLDFLILQISGEKKLFSQWFSSFRIFFRLIRSHQKSSSTSFRLHREPKKPSGKLYHTLYYHFSPSKKFYHHISNFRIRFYQKLNIFVPWSSIAFKIVKWHNEFERTLGWVTILSIISKQCSFWDSIRSILRVWIAFIPVIIIQSLLMLNRCPTKLWFFSQKRKWW